MTSKEDFSTTFVRYKAGHALESVYENYRIQLNKNLHTTVSEADYELKGRIEYNATLALVDSKNLTKPRIAVKMSDTFTISPSKTDKFNGLDYIKLDDNEIVIGCRFDGKADFIAIEKDGKFSQGQNKSPFPLTFEELTPAAQKFMTDNADTITALSAELKAVRGVALRDLSERAKSDNKLSNVMELTQLQKLPSNAVDDGAQRRNAISQVRQTSIS